MSVNVETALRLNESTAERWPHSLPSPRSMGSLDEVSVGVVADDPLNLAGMLSQLRDMPGIRLAAQGVPAHVAIVVGNLDESLLFSVRRLRAEGTQRVLVCAPNIDEAGLFAAVEAGACGVVRRADATPEQLARTLRSAACGDGALPPDLLGKLLEHVQTLQSRLLAPLGLRFSGLTTRETEVLRLLADGFETKEIAEKLSWSERTVKNVIHDVYTRLQLRNRAHAVAYAIRQGLI